MKNLITIAITFIALFGLSGCASKNSVANSISKETLDDELPFDSVYDQPLIEFMLYKLLSGDNAQGQSSGVHLKTALDLIDVKSVSDVNSSPAKE